MNARKTLLLVALASALVPPVGLFGQAPVAEPQVPSAAVFFDAETLQARIQAVHAKVAPAVVSLVEGQDGDLEGVASGVLVSADGLVLTAGHCFEEPGEKVKIQLGDGRVLNAMTLGKQRALDFGLIRISEASDLPFCEIGDVKALVRDDVCLMYGDPDGIKVGRPPVVRLGTFLGVREDGMLRTSCLMMPGDSGGPLFDLDGRVIGINSEIDLALDDNFHASVQAVRENWERLLEGEAWGIDPNEGWQDEEWSEYGYEEMQREPEYDLPREPTAETDLGRLLPGGLEGLREVFSTVTGGVSPSVCRLRSAQGEELFSVLGTVVGADGWIVSKSSRVGDFDVRCDLQGRAPLNAEVIARDRALDLVLLRVPLQDLRAVTLESERVNLAPGSLVGSLDREGRVVHAGVYGVAPRKIARARTGYLGIYFASSAGGPPFIEEAPGGQPAALAGLAADDVILGFDDVEIDTENALRNFLRSTDPGQSIRVRIRRAEETKTIEVVLGIRDDFEAFGMGMMHPAYETQISRRRGGFESAFRHDMPLDLYECGGPVIDLEGRVVGLNVARVDRPGSLALPIDLVAEFVARHR